MTKNITGTIAIHLGAELYEKLRKQSQEEYRNITQTTKMIIEQYYKNKGE